MQLLTVILLMIMGNTNNVKVDELTYAMKSEFKRYKGYDTSKFNKYAELFIKYGIKWKVNPILASCVGLVESRYRENPKTFARICRVKNNCPYKPGPCYLKKIWTKTCQIERVNKNEEGMMQVLYNDKSTRIGYKRCTGDNLRWRREPLRKPSTAICIGMYELSNWRRWVRLTWWAKPKGAFYKSFFRKNPNLKKFFYVGFYNWGPRNISNSYPRRVLQCYQRYARRINEYKSRKISVAVKRENKTPKGLQSVQKVPTQTSRQNKARGSNSGRESRLQVHSKPGPS